jgi:hypothetical protein
LFSTAADFISRLRRKTADNDRWREFRTGPTLPRELDGLAASRRPRRSDPAKGRLHGRPGRNRAQGKNSMLKLSEILVSRKDIESFDELIAAVQDTARNGERFFRMDVKPPYPDTPEDWEDRLEAAFSGLVR